MAAPVKVARQQIHRNSPEPELCLRNIRQHAPELFGTLRNLPNSASGTYTNTGRNSPEPSGTFHDLPEPTFRNLPEPTTSGTSASIHRNPPKSSGTFRELASGTYTIILHRNSPEPSATCLRNLHQHTPEPSGTVKNPPPEPTPAHARTFRNLPEPSSGTCSCDPHRHTPELIWAEDPISLRCWGKKRLMQIVAKMVGNSGFPENQQINCIQDRLKQIGITWNKPESNHLQFEGPQPQTGPAESLLAAPLKSPNKKPSS